MSQDPIMRNSDGTPVTDQQWRDTCERQWPAGKIADRRRITGCSHPKAWYSNKVGEIITVHYFVTFGCWDINGRWLDYYDLSAPIKRELSEKETANLMSVEMTRINLAHAYMRKWDDIPLAWQMDDLCKMLEIKNNKAAYNFCMGLLLRPDAESAKMLFDIRKHEFKEPTEKQSWIKKIFK